MLRYKSSISYSISVRISTSGLPIAIINASVVIMDKKEFQRRREKIQADIIKANNNSEILLAEGRRTEQYLRDAKEELAKLEQEFERRTSLTGKDWPFLVVALSMQLVRIYVLPQLQQQFDDNFKPDFDSDTRLNHNDVKIKDMEKKAIDSFKEKHKEWQHSLKGNKYKSWESIASTKKVPYDATTHSGIRPADYSGTDEFAGRNMHAGFHRVKTLGHDPYLGWIFGTANIITDTITITPEYELGEKKYRIPVLESYNVKDGIWYPPRRSTIGVLEEAIDSIIDDKKRLPAALFAQGLHLASDKYTHEGLPIPFLGTIDIDSAYELYQKNYDCLNFENDFDLPLKLLDTGKQAALSALINRIISGFHLFYYNPEQEPNLDLYLVRNKKIVLYSNLIATSSDLIQAAIRAANGDTDSLNNLDWGGLMVTIVHLCRDTEFMQDVKREFVFKGYEDGLDINNKKLNSQLQ